MQPRAWAAAAWSLWLRVKQQVLGAGLDMDAAAVPQQQAVLRPNRWHLALGVHMRPAGHAAAGRQQNVLAQGVNAAGPERGTVRMLAVQQLKPEGSKLRWPPPLEVRGIQSLWTGVLATVLGMAGTSAFRFKSRTACVQNWFGSWQSITAFGRDCGTCLCDCPSGR